MDTRPGKPRENHQIIPHQKLTTCKSSKLFISNAPYSSCPTHRSPPTRQWPWIFFAPTTMDSSTVIFLRIQPMLPQTYFFRKRCILKFLKTNTHPKSSPHSPPGTPPHNPCHDLFPPPTHVVAAGWWPRGMPLLPSLPKTNF